MRRRLSGFTLIELMVVVVILGILLSIAIPAYSDYMRKAARAQAKGRILDLAQVEERFFTNNATYWDSTMTVPTGWQDYTYSGSDYASRKYDIAVAAGATGSIATSFIITATPANGFADPVCGNLTVDSNGSKASSVAGATCW